MICLQSGFELQVASFKLCRRRYGSAFPLVKVPKAPA